MIGNPGVPGGVFCALSPIIARSSPLLPPSATLLLRYIVSCLWEFATYRVHTYDAYTRVRVCPTLIHIFWDQIPAGSAIFRRHDFTIGPFRNFSLSLFFFYRRIEGNALYAPKTDRVVASVSQCRSLFLTYA